MTPSNEIIISSPDAIRDRIVASKIKSMFAQGTKICAISPSLKSMDKYHGIVSQYKAWEFQEDSGDSVRFHIDVAFNTFLEMGFAEPLSKPSLLIIEDFDRLLSYIQNDTRLMSTLTTLFELSNKKKVSIWIIADSHQILSQPKYKNILENFQRTLLLNSNKISKINPQGWSHLCEFLQIDNPKVQSAYEKAKQTIEWSTEDTCLYDSSSKLWSLA